MFELTSFHDIITSNDHSKAKEVEDSFDKAIEKLKSLGAIVLDPVDIPSTDEWMTSDSTTTVQLVEFKEGVRKYLASMRSTQVKCLRDIIECVL